MSESLDRSIDENELSRLNDKHMNPNAMWDFWAAVCERRVRDLLEIERGTTAGKDMSPRIIATDLALVLRDFGITNADPKDAVPVILQIVRDRAAADQGQLADH